jgi:hypothetical protein
MVIQARDLSAHGFLHAPDPSLGSFLVCLQDSIEWSLWAPGPHCGGAGEDAPDGSCQPGLLLLLHVLQVLQADQESFLCDLDCAPNARLSVADRRGSYYTVSFKVCGVAHNAVADVFGFTKRLSHPADSCL